MEETPQEEERIEEDAAAEASERLARDCLTCRIYYSVKNAYEDWVCRNVWVRRGVGYVAYGWAVLKNAWFYVYNARYLLAAKRRQKYLQKYDCFGNLAGEEEDVEEEEDGTEKKKK